MIWQVQQCQIKYIGILETESAIEISDIQLRFAVKVGEVVDITFIRGIEGSQIEATFMIKRTGRHPDPRIRRNMVVSCTISSRWKHIPTFVGPRGSMSRGSSASGSMFNVDILRHYNQRPQNQRFGVYKTLDMSSEWRGEAYQKARIITEHSGQCDAISGK